MMAKSKQEIRDFLNAQVGRKVNTKCGSLNGQCVSLIKALMEFLGVSDPYGARGNAKDAGDTYIRQGIGKRGQGWLTICVNRNMGGGYGHIWVDLTNEANYEQNGARALSTTKNTRSISQAQQFVNFDQWVASEPAPSPSPSGGRVPQNGTFKANMTMKIRWEPGLNGKYSGVNLPAGGTVKYDSYIDVDGIRWISYMGNSGNRCYIARRKLDNSVIYGEAY
jgi:hypothetical protein